VRRRFRHLKVLLSKRLARFKYDYREEWLRLIDNLSSTTNPLPIPERAVMSLAVIIDSPGGLLFVQEQDHSIYVPAASWGIDELTDSLWQELPYDALMAHMERSAWIVDGEEPLPIESGNDFLASLANHLGNSVLVVPLLLQDRLFGFAALKKKVPGYRLTYEDIDLLRTGGRQVASYLAQHYISQRLAEARQFEAYGRMTAFMIHDLKNIMAQQSLLVQNAARHKHNPSFIDDALRTIESSIGRMDRVLRQLRAGTGKSAPRQTDLREIVTDAVERCRVFAPAPELEAPSTPLSAIVDGERLAFGLTNLIRNAQQAASATGSVKVRLLRDERMAVIEVIDDGPGMSDSFVNQRLFRPFDSTSPDVGMGLGAYQLREMIRSIGGTVSVKSGTGCGARFQLRIPLAEATKAVSTTSADTKAETNLP
jgi:putative PEP-CTERM system histidine kinase